MVYIYFASQMSFIGATVCSVGQVYWCYNIANSGISSLMSGSKIALKGLMHVYVRSVQDTDNLVGFTVAFGFV